MEIFNKKESKQVRKILRKNSTQAEHLLWQELRGKKLLDTKFKRQFSVDKYILDFFCPQLNLVIELDGDIHLEKEAVEYDKIRTIFLNGLGLKVIRFTNDEVFENLSLVLEKIENEILNSGV